MSPRYPDSAPTVQRRTPLEVTRHAAEVAADGDKRTRNPLLRDALSRIDVRQLAHAVDHIERHSAGGDR